MILEKLNGKTLASILGSKRSGIQDVHYLRKALLQVLSSLSVQQWDTHVCGGPVSLSQSSAALGSLLCCPVLPC